jgi:DNA-binding HxlR family transcriptional regulator
MSTRMRSVIDDPLREAAEVAGDRWMLLSLAALSNGPRRFGDLLAELGGIAPNVLIDRLRRMERHGLMASTPYSQRPRRYVYDLTEAGRELAAILPVLAAWAQRRAGGEPPRHDACGSALELRAWCPTCSVALEPENGPTSSNDEDVRWL